MHGPGLDRVRGRERTVGPAGGRRARLPRGRRRRARRRGGRRPQRPSLAGTSRLQPRAGAARRGRRASRADQARPAQPRLARRGDCAVLERPPLRLPHRLRRVGGPPVSRLRDGARPLGARPAHRRPAGHSRREGRSGCAGRPRRHRGGDRSRDRGGGRSRRLGPRRPRGGAASLPGLRRAGASQDPLQDGHLAAGQLPRRAAVRGRRPRLGPHRAGVPRHAVAHRRSQRGGTGPGDRVDPPAGVSRSSASRSSRTTASSGTGHAANTTSTIRRRPRRCAAPASRGCPISIAATARSSRSGRRRCCATCCGWSATRRARQPASRGTAWSR